MKAMQKNIHEWIMSTISVLLVKFLDCLTNSCNNTNILNIFGDFYQGFFRGFSPKIFGVFWLLKIFTFPAPFFPRWLWFPLSLLFLKSFSSREWGEKIQERESSYYFQLTEPSHEQTKKRPCQFISIWWPQVFFSLFLFLSFFSPLLHCLTLVNQPLMVTPLLPSLKRGKERESMR